MADRVSLKLGPVEKRLLMRIADALDRMAPPSPGRGRRGCGSLWLRRVRLCGGRFWRAASEGDGVYSSVVCAVYGDVSCPGFAGVPYESVDVSVDAEALERVKALGYLQAPVVIWEREAYPAEHVSGFRPDFVQRIAEYREMRAASIDEMGDE